MILELLQPDPDPWDALAVVVRAGYNFAGLCAAGLALFLAGYGAALDAAARAEMRALLARLAIFGLVLSVLALFVRAAQLSGGEDIFDETIWAAMARGRVGDAFALRAAGFGLLLAGARWGAVLGPMGALLIAASYAGMGHSTLYRPRQELAALVTLHLLAVSFWIGSLPALIAAARRADVTLIRAWSRAAMGAVAVMLATGAALIFYLVGRFDLLIASWHGWALIAKLILVAGALGLAIRHKLAATPALERGQAGAGDALARSIGRELALAALVCYAAAELVSVHPLDYGHRIAS
ncbi:MAG: CopD family protein [Tagaea sp.]|nr:CopD family protein [Tagaea sp.]